MLLTEGGERRRGREKKIYTELNVPLTSLTDWRTRGRGSREQKSRSKRREEASMGSNATGGCRFKLRITLRNK